MSSRPRALPPSWYVLASIVSVQVGAAIAKSLFGEIGATSMVWLRLASSTVILLVVAPALRARSRRSSAARRAKTAREWLVALGFGLMLVGMNWSIYQSFARIPLGMAVTLEFLGPLVLSVVLSHRARDLIWVALAALGVALLGATPAGLTWVGVAFALAAGAFWAGYIVLAERTGRSWPGISGLVVASCVGTALLAVPALAESGRRLADPRVLAIGAAVGLLSSVIPYSLELVALRRIPRHVFSVLMSLEPAAAALAAMLIVREWLEPLQWLAIACVVAASIGAARPQTTPSQTQNQTLP